MLLEFLCRVNSYQRFKHPGSDGGCYINIDAYTTKGMTNRCGASQMNDQVQALKS